MVGFCVGYGNRVPKGTKIEEATTGSIVWGTLRRTNLHVLHRILRIVGGSLVLQLLNSHSQTLNADPWTYI